MVTTGGKSGQPEPQRREVGRAVRTRVMAS